MYVINIAFAIFSQKLEAAQSDSSDVAQENAKKDEMLKAKNDELLAVTTKLKEAEALNTSHQVAVENKIRFICVLLFSLVYLVKPFYKRKPVLSLS